MIASLPLRVITFNTQGVDPTKVQLLIHADVGRAYEAPQNVAVAYIIVDQSGRIVDSQSTTQRLVPTPGMASPLPFVVSAAVPPGDYVLKLAAVEGGKTGTVQHRVTAALIGAPAAPDVKLSDLIVGGPLSATGTMTRPSVDYVVRFGIVQGYLEAYGAAAANTKVRYEIARDDQSPPLVAEAVAPRVVNQSRALFSRTLSASALPPGTYRLRAIVTVGGSPVATLSRRFELAAPTAAAASAAAADVPRRSATLDSRTEFFLPIATADLAAPFQVADALRPETLEPFSAMVPAAARTSFDEGIRHLRARNYRAAEDSFKRAILPDSDFTAATVYLAVTFAASAHYIDAANAWQTALIGRSDLPQLYLWLGTALLRAREFGRAQSILEEAAGRWPADTRFARPLAMLYATTGKGYDAMQMLQRHLAATTGDVDALYLGVQWIYQMHVNGAVLRDRAADLALARAYADQYLRVNGPKEVLVKEWIDYLAR
jgi:Tfp pilus assembly protein PilF